MAQNINRFVLKAVTITLAVSTLGLANARADIDPVVCGIGGAIGGGAIGNQFGGGTGRDIMTIIGMVAGAAIAHDFCKQAEDPEDIRIAQQNEHEILTRGSDQQREWSNPRYGRHSNARSSVARRGWYGNRECSMTRSVMQSSEGGRYVNETYWCNDRGQWSQVTETTTISQIRWGANGPVQSTTTETTTTYDGGRRRPSQPDAILPRWIVSESRMEGIKSDLSNEWAHPERAARMIADDLLRSNQFLTLDQLGNLLKDLRFDSERGLVLRELAPYVDQRFGSMSTVSHAYDFDRGRESARSLLDRLNRQQQAGQRHEGRDRRDPWPHRR